MARDVMNSYHTCQLNINVHGVIHADYQTHEGSAECCVSESKR